MADSGGTAPSMNRCTRLLRHPQAVTNLQVIQVTSSIRAEIQAWLSWPRALPLATEVMGVSSSVMRIPAYAATLCNIGDGHLVHIMAYFFQCTQTTEWKPSNLAVPEWEVQQFDHAQKEPHDKVALLLFVKVRKYACGDESCNQTMDDNPPTAPRR